MSYEVSAGRAEIFAVFKRALGQNLSTEDRCAHCVVLGPVLNAENHCVRQAAGSIAG